MIYNDNPVMQNVQSFLQGLNENRQMPTNTPQMRNVFSDIDALKVNVSSDEAAFIAADPEYMAASEMLTKAFYQFLEMRFRNEFAQVDKDGYAEKSLLALKKAKEKYQQTAAKKQSEINTLLNDPEIKAIIEKRKVQN